MRGVVNVTVLHGFPTECPPAAAATRDLRLWNVGVALCPIGPCDSRANSLVRTRDALAGRTAKESFKMLGTKDRTLVLMTAHFELFISFKELCVPF